MRCFLTALAAFAPGAAAAGPALTATEAYCIIDADTGLVLAQQNMNEELHPASITKVMTLGLACEKGPGQVGQCQADGQPRGCLLAGGHRFQPYRPAGRGRKCPLTDALYATMMASANDGANLLAEYFGGGSIEGGVAAMNAQAKELGLEHTHFANPHGISDEDHYTSCYDMAQILRWALTQPGFETLFTRNEMYTMGPTNVQPVTRYFHQQDKMRVGSSRYYIPAILGSKDRLHQHCPVQLCLPGGAERRAADLRDYAEPDQDRQIQRCPHPAGRCLCPLHRLHRDPCPGRDRGSWKWRAAAARWAR